MNAEELEPIITRDVNKDTQNFILECFGMDNDNEPATENN